MIPEGWKQVSLGEIAEVSTGGTPDRSNSEYWGGNVPWIKTSSINFNTISEADEFITEDGLRSSAATLLAKETIVMAMYGQGATRGRVAMLGIEAATNQACAAIVALSGTDRKYLFYYLSSLYERVRTLSQGGSQRNLNTDLIRGIRVLYPPLPEQRKIAEILSTWDEALALLDRRIELAAQRKKGLMQRLLTGRVRFAEFEGEPWRKVRLGDIFARVTRTTSVDIDAVLSITAGVGFEHQREKFGRIIAGKSLKRYTLLRRGDFAYNKGNSLTYPQGCVYLLEEYEEASVPNVYYCFRAKSREVYAPFYKYYFENGALNRELRGLINAGVRNDGLLNLSADDFFGCRILLPPVSEQRRIAEVFETSDREIELLQRKRELLRQQKKGLMQRLLTGRVRVRI